MVNTRRLNVLADSNLNSITVFNGLSNHGVDTQMPWRDP